MNSAQESARKILYQEIPENSRRGFNADYGITLGPGSTYYDALVAVYKKRAAEGDKEAKEALREYGWVE